jgi:hypothetical protein
MNPVRGIGFPATMLLENSFVGACAIAQHDGAAAVNKRAVELYEIPRNHAGGTSSVGVSGENRGADHPTVAMSLGTSFQIIRIPTCVWLNF